MDLRLFYLSCDLLFKKFSKITEKCLFLVGLYSEEFQETSCTKQGLFPAKNDILSSLAVGGRWITTQSSLQVWCNCVRSTEQT